MSDRTSKITTLDRVIPVGTNSAATGVISVDGTSYTVTRLRKDDDRLVFFTGTQEVHVRKFVNGTDIGVYTDLAITTQVVLGAMNGGIESMWIVPWAHATYDIGQTLKRFRSLYLSLAFDSK
jgi:riboflavin synthase alpha subunit